ncbi:MbtH family protein [Pseudomonas sp. NPDC089554]|uniref:MbtH family protein n=1 Tax=Pseudomonas sp. NPDC089554 TaxID=3390653 RepID=UPI003D04C271
MSLDNPDTRFLVVVNDEQQYSIWPDYKSVPQGWRSTGCEGSKQECLAYIESVWTDMRPLSLRQAMQANGQG